ncbi:hypothetical protein JCM21900_001811 [Sporobolomyces salmonicolor]
MHCSGPFAALLVLPFALATPGFGSGLANGGVGVNQNQKFPVGEFHFDYDQHHRATAYDGGGQKGRHTDDYELENVRLGIDQHVNIGHVGGSDLGLDLGLDYQDLDRKDHTVEQHHARAGTLGGGKEARIELADVDADALKRAKLDRDDEDVAWVTRGGKDRHALLASNQDQAQELEKEKFRAQKLEAIRIKAHAHEDAELKKHQDERQKAAEQKGEMKERGEGEKGVFRS